MGKLYSLGIISLKLLEDMKEMVQRPEPLGTTGKTLRETGREQSPWEMETQEAKSDPKNQMQSEKQDQRNGNIFSSL